MKVSNNGAARPARTGPPTAGMADTARTGPPTAGMADTAGGSPPTGVADTAGGSPPTGVAVADVHAGYRGRPVLRGVSLRAEPGTVTAIVGPNGCGKSTLLRVMARLHRPAAGTVHVGGEDVWALPPRRTARLVGHLPQAPGAPDGVTVAALVAFGRHPHQSALRRWSPADEAAHRGALDAIGLADLADRRLDTLSGGQRQRAWIAMALAQDTPVLLLDEPVSALDLGHQFEVLDLLGRIAAAGRAVVVVLHDLAAAARHADRMIALDDGRVVADGPADSVVTEELVRSLYGVDVEIVRRADGSAPVVIPTALHEEVTRAPR